MNQIAMKARVTGNVQGVAFRAWTQAMARKLKLTGWVRNDDRGAVSALFDGDRDTVHEMIGQLWSGPGAASVQNVQTELAEHRDSRAGFEIRT